MAEIIILFLGIVGSVVLALLKITVWTSLFWIAIPVPILISLVIILFIHGGDLDLFG